MIELISRFYTHSVNIYTITESVSTETGENIKTESTVAVNLKCRIRPLTNQESYYQNKNNLEVTHYMYCPVSTAYNQLDRVVYGASTYEITGIINPMGMDKYQSVQLKAVT